MLFGSFYRLRIEDKPCITLDDQQGLEFQRQDVARSWTKARFYTPPTTSSSITQHLAIHALNHVVDKESRRAWPCRSHAALGLACAIILFSGDLFELSPTFLHASALYERGKFTFGPLLRCTEKNWHTAARRLHGVDMRWCPSVGLGGRGMWIYSSFPLFVVRSSLK